MVKLTPESLANELAMLAAWRRRQAGLDRDVEGHESAAAMLICFARALQDQAISLPTRTRLAALSETQAERFDDLWFRHGLAVGFGDEWDTADIFIDYVLDQVAAASRTFSRR